MTGPRLAAPEAGGEAASPKIELFGLSFTAVTLARAVELLILDAASRARGLVITPNVDHIVLISESDRLKRIYQGARWLFADGMPIVWLSRVCHRSGLPERVTGSDLFVRLCARAADSGLRVFLLGGAPGVAQTAASRLMAAHPGLMVAGAYSPPIGFDEDAAETRRIIEICNAAHPDILFLGLGTPKQERWAAANLEALDAGPVLCVGGSFDFVAGTTIRAPRMLQSVGLEWFWRLAHEPRRLWKRYLVRDSRFVGLALREAIATWQRR
jgi:N-acetylglucosaminyldiphosphoundecaprenol N-acetyl-beta-D-mannosaminyltransferase